MPAVVQPPRSGRYTYVAVLTLTLTVFAAVVAFVTAQLRGGLRDQILRREGEWFATVASIQIDNEASLAGVAEVPGGVFAAAFKTSKMRAEIFELRVFDAARALSIALPYWFEEPPSDADWMELRAGRPRVRLHRRATIAFLANQATTARAPHPVLEAWVPLRRAENSPLLGAAQFWIDGSKVAEELHALDVRLLGQAAAAWCGGSFAIALALAWAFRRLDAANRELEVRGEDLAQANRELVLAAKTSALGAVTAHLIHELKNPVAGLETFVASQTESAGGGGSGVELAAASELTRRLRAMINDVVGVLRDEQHGTDFELTCAEVAELAIAKARPAAARRGVHLIAEAAHAASLPGRRANLAGLVLQNLLQNAAEASLADSRVRLGSRATAGGAVEFLVEDSGSGLPEAIRGQLFQPVPSSKPGGSGIGLALSYQLAQQAGGRLELLRSDARGTCFRLILPLER